MGIFGLFRIRPKKNFILFEGGPGDSTENAVVIHAPDTILGVLAEYQYVGNLCGVRNRDWKLCMQSLVSGNSKTYDVLDIELKDGTRRTFYFDISDFFGKFYASPHVPRN
jgi:hypothetical protein